MLSNKQKALIHVAKAKTGMTDPEYRAMLSSVGAGSSVDLDWRGFKVVMERFKALGFKPQLKAQSSKLKAPTSKEKLLGKIDAILAGLGLPRRYAETMAKTMFDLDLLQWCNAGQLHKLVAALTYHQQRVSRRAATGGDV